jgi:hypothetical protein
LGGIILSLFSADVSAENLGQWGYKGSSSGLRYLAAGKQESEERVPISLEIWRDSGRDPIIVNVDSAVAKKEQEKGSWSEYLRAKTDRPDHLILLYLSDKPERYWPVEFEPVLTISQEAYRKSLPVQWLVPLPDSFSESLSKGTIFTWNVDADTCNARIRVGRTSAPRNNGGKGGMLEQIYWFDHDLSVDEAMIAVMANDWQVESHEQFNHSFLWRDWDYGSFSGPEFAWIYWQSGRFIIHLRVPKAEVSEVAKSYLAKYPPTWDGQLDFNQQRLTLHVLNRSLVTMEKHIDDPLEFLRYSFRRYPFDAAFIDALNIILGEAANDLRSQHEKGVERIHTTWAETPKDKMRLEDYRAALLIHRRELLSSISAIRDRVKAHGYKRGNNKKLVYGDEQ